MAKRKQVAVVVGVDLDRFSAGLKMVGEGTQHIQGREQCEFSAGCDQSEMTRTPLSRSILLCWELGGGLGHSFVLAPLAESLASAGHSVTLALRDMRGVQLPRSLPPGTQLVQSPARPTGSPRLSPRMAGYVHILLNAGFGDTRTVMSHVSQWLSLMRQNNAEVIVADHAPTVLLAARIAGRPVAILASDSVARARPASIASGGR